MKSLNIDGQEYTAQDVCNLVKLTKAFINGFQWESEAEKEEFKANMADKFAATLDELGVSAEEMDKMLYGKGCEKV